MWSRLLSSVLTFKLTSAVEPAAQPASRAASAGLTPARFFAWIQRVLRLFRPCNPARFLFLESISSTPPSLSFFSLPFYHEPVNFGGSGRSQRPPPPLLRFSTDSRIVWRFLNGYVELLRFPRPITRYYVAWCAFVRRHADLRSEPGSLPCVFVLHLTLGTLDARMRAVEIWEPGLFECSLAGLS